MANKKYGDWSVVDSLSSTKQYVDVEEPENKYVPWLVNRHFSNFIDTVLHSNEMNMHADLDPKLQYDYYFGSVRKSRRWYKKGLKEDSYYVDAICERYKYSRRRAEEVMRTLSKEQIEAVGRHAAGEPF